MVMKIIKTTFFFFFLILNPKIASHTPAALSTYNDSKITPTNHRRGVPPLTAGNPDASGVG